MFMFLKKTLSFDRYRRIAPILIRMHEIVLRLRFFIYTRGKRGRSLHDSSSQKWNRALSSPIIRSVPYLLLLAIMLAAPCVLPWETREMLALQDKTIVAGFLGAMLTVAGVFLTLFHTNMLSIYASKYPDGNDFVSKMFSRSMSEMPELSFCGSYVVVAVFAMAVLGFIGFNWPAFLYVCVLSVILISKMLRVINPRSTQTELADIVVPICNRLLAAAVAASYEFSFYESRVLMDYFKRVVSGSLSDLGELMNFAIVHEKRGRGDAGDVASLVLLVLGKYNDSRKVIPDESPWQPTEYVYKSWLESDSFEVSLAMRTGTVPRPKSIPKPYGIESSLMSINDKYRDYLASNNVEGKEKSVLRLVQNSQVIDAAVEHSISLGQIGWIAEQCPAEYQRAFEFASTLSTNMHDELMVQCGLLEAYAISMMTIPLGLTDLCKNLDPRSFKYDSFSSFSREELLRKGFPVANDQKAVALCGQIERELFVASGQITPSWYFDKEICSISISVIGKLASLVGSLFKEYETNLESLIQEKIRSSYIMVFKEAEYFEKTGNCLHVMAELVDRFGAGGRGQLGDVEAEINNLHRDIQLLYPDVVCAFQQEKSDLKDVLPDLYGFVLYRYCKLTLDDIVRGSMDSFGKRMLSLYLIAGFASNDRRDKLQQKQYTYQYEAQVLLTPMLFFFELCGMAYAMAELIGRQAVQQEITDWVECWLEGRPEDAGKWAAALKLSRSTLGLGKAYEDMSWWRQSFTDVAQSQKNYPKDGPFPLRREKPSEEQRRLIDMFPSGPLAAGMFDGCEVFSKFVLEPITRDDGDVDGGPRGN